MRTCLYDQHIQLGAKMVDFAGWEMPLQYEGILAEHMAVRSHAGIFDVSHMGRIDILGDDAALLLEYLSTNRIGGKKEQIATYTVWCRENGTCIDDLLVYRLHDAHYFVVINASNREKDLHHLEEHAKKFNVQIIPRFDEGILSVQGPAVELPIKEMKPMRVMETAEGYCIATAGYTGAGGYEIYGNSEVIKAKFAELIEQGVTPIGLGARDTLRLEMGYALYGHELTDDIRANETVAAWTIKMDKKSFLGKEALGQPGRHQQGIILEDKRIARQGDEIIRESQTIGVVTSGTYSPSLEKPIAIVIVSTPLHPGEKVEVSIRGRQYPAQVVRLPFWKKERIS